jgi:thiamine-phosphate pyrophosphorylase
MSLRGLYAITPEQPRSDTSLTLQVSAAVAGGARLIQYRDKTHDTAKRQRQARELLAVCHRQNALLIINDDVELAAAIGADGVHLGKDDMPPSEAKQRLGATALIGVSCYNALANAERAQALGADYVAFGRFFPSASKPLALPAKLELLRAARRTLHLPLVAIGGISPENARPLITAGADMLAAIDSVFGQPDIGAASRAFSDLFKLQEEYSR